MKEKKKASIVHKAIAAIIGTALLVAIVCGSLWLALKAVQALLGLF